MKLQNKETLKVVDVEIKSAFYDNIVKIKLIDKATGAIVAMYTSLAELNEEWQDYEEPKKGFKKFLKINRGFCVVFYDEETAEKEFEKAKAWQRLKEKNTAVDLSPVDAVGTATLFVRYERKDHDEVQDLLNFLFGGKNEIRKKVKDQTSKDSEKEEVIAGLERMLNLWKKPYTNYEILYALGKCQDAIYKAIDFIKRGR